MDIKRPPRRDAGKVGEAPVVYPKTYPTVSVVSNGEGLTMWNGASPTSEERAFYANLAFPDDAPAEAGEKS